MMLPITFLALLAPALATLLHPFSFHLSRELGGDGIERRQIRTCQGSLVFQTCPDGSSCAPPGFFCCGTTGACTVGDLCIDGFGCCPAGTPEKLCRGAADLMPGTDISSMSAYISSMLGTRSQNLFYTTSVPPGQGFRTSTNTRTALAAASSFAWPEKDVTTKGSVISMKGKRSRRIDLENEVSATDEWATVLSCDASKAGLRTNSSVARLEMKLSTDVAGISIASQSADTDGTLKLGYVDDSVSLEDQVEVLPLFPTKNGTSTGCEVTLKWSREIEQGGVAQTVEISVSWPITLKRQEKELWTQINQIVVYADKEAMDQAKLGETFDPDTVTGSPSAALSPTAQSQPTAGQTSSVAPSSSASSSPPASASSSAVEAKPDTEAVEASQSSGSTLVYSVWGLVVSAVLALVV